MFDMDDLKIFFMLIVLILSNAIGLIVLHRPDVIIENLSWLKLIVTVDTALFVILLIAGIIDGSRN